MAALNYDEENRAPNRQEVLLLQLLFRGRFSFEESRELIAARGGYQQAANFVLTGNPDEVTTFIFGRREDLRDLREVSAARVHQELTEGINTSIRLFACGRCKKYWWRKVPQYKEVSKCHRCQVKYDPVPRDKEWGLALFECDCGNSFKTQGMMNETTRKCYECRANLYPTKIIPPFDDLQLNPRRAPMRQILRQRISREVYYPSQVHQSTGSTVQTCLPQGNLREKYNFPIDLCVIDEEDGDSDDDNDLN